jgi:uncharacterized Fe-S center protein
MPSDVFFADARETYGKNLFNKTAKLLKKLNLRDMVNAGDTVAIKVHWGEKGNTGYISPQVARLVVDAVRDLGGKPFITDTNTLYRGTRRIAPDNIMTAIENGFAPSVVHAPVIVADGLYGHDFVEVPVKGKHFKSVKIAGGIHYAKAMIVISHAKGHLATGMGGALKNISMGCASPAGKQNMHSDVKPSVDAEKCIACGSCMKVCPAAAISRRKDKKAQIDKTRCIGCAECVVVCPGAIEVEWESEASLLQEKMAEYARGALAGKENKCAFLNFATNITPDCDCVDWTDAPFVADAGVLASRDPVAVDQASADLINQSPWTPYPHKLKTPDAADKFVALHNVDWQPHVAAAEAMGCGSRRYNLVKIR